MTAILRACVCIKELIKDSLLISFVLESGIAVVLFVFCYELHGSNWNTVLPVADYSGKKTILCKSLLTFFVATFSSVPGTVHTSLKIDWWFILSTKENEATRDFISLPLSRILPIWMSHYFLSLLYYSFIMQVQASGHYIRNHLL